MTKPDSTDVGAAFNALLSGEHPFPTTGARPSCEPHSDPWLTWPRLQTRIVGWSLLAILVGVFAVYVWPTPYRYDHASVRVQFNRSRREYVPIRTNRFTGRIEWLSADWGAWAPLGIAAPPR